MESVLGSETRCVDGVSCRDLEDQFTFDVAHPLSCDEENGCVLVDPLLIGNGDLRGRENTADSGRGPTILTVETLLFLSSATSVLGVCSVASGNRDDVGSGRLGLAWNILCFV